MGKYIDSLRVEISKYLNTDNIFFHYKGRVSLYAILKAMGVTADDEVIIPAFTCVVVPNPIIYLGAKPIYVEIWDKTLTMDIAQLEDKITTKTKVIICQNTYGLSGNVDKIIALAKKYNLYTIEDCTHGFGGTFNGKPNGSYCDAAFYSMQWNKPFSSGVGGFMTINNPALTNKIVELEKEKLEPGIVTKLNLRVLFFTKRYLLNNTTYWIMVKAYRWLSKNNLVTGSSTGGEISDIIMADDFFMNYSDVQAKEGLRSIKKLPELLILRKENARNYSDFLKKNNKRFVSDDLIDNHSFLKYPLFVKDRELFLEHARKHKIELGDWFNSPIHPVQSGFEKWFINPADFPLANYASQHVVNIPTDTLHIARIIAFLEMYEDEII
jgi:dTDP-4-amino-4,6-dideoxygalactose transaminase